MGKRTRPEYLLLIRGQVPYRGTWIDVLSQKGREMKSNFLHQDRIIRRDNINVDPPEGPVHPRIALWFYKGTTTKPDDVRTFAFWYDTHEKEKSLTDEEGCLIVPGTPFYVFAVAIYFPNEHDWYVQSGAEYAKFDYGVDPQAAQTFSQRHFVRVSRKNYHDPPGRNVLVLTNVHSMINRHTGRSVALNLAEYEICRGPRLGMNAREYFADGRSGQRVAILKRIPSTEPAHLVRLHMGANLDYPYALRVTRK